MDNEPLQEKKEESWAKGKEKKDNLLKETK
jgi:hypothetical protein